MVKDRDNFQAGVESVLVCQNLEAALAFYVGHLGFRLDMIMPADAPRVAIVSGFGICLRLQLRSALDNGVAPDGSASTAINPLGGQSLDLAIPVIERSIIKRAEGKAEWSAGRAGMHYRDLISDRVGGFVIASQIRIEHGGPVDDYVHYHKVSLQLIYCRRGWVRVVYEDQGPSFVMQPGDCVLQPPTIRHRVLESSAGLEVIELGIPAEHETWRDHDLSLPTAMINPHRHFGGQRFVRHIASDAIWQDAAGNAASFRDIGISPATGGSASARIFKLNGSDVATASIALAASAFRFLFVLDNLLQLNPTEEQPLDLSMEDACVLTSNKPCTLTARTEVEFLEVCVPAI